MRRSHRRARLFTDVQRRLRILHLHVDIDVDVLVEIVAGQRRRGDLRSRHLSRVCVAGAAFVVHQMMPSSESHLTLLAFERFLAFVDQQMSLQLVRVAELGRAQLARVRPLAGVHAQMAAQVGHLDELTVTVATVVGFLARV